MAAATLKDQVEKLNGVLETLETRVTGHEVPREELEELRMAVDAIRRTVWALLTDEESSGENELVIARSRLHHAVQLCQQVVLDINAGYVPPESAELGRLYSVLKDTLASMERAITGGA